MPLGDVIEAALDLVGVSQEVVEKFLGRPCGCEERKQKLNQLSAWAARVVRGKIDRAEEYLERIMK